MRRSLHRLGAVSVGCETTGLPASDALSEPLERPMVDGHLRREPAIRAHCGRLLDGVEIRAVSKARADFCSPFSDEFGRVRKSEKSC
jgi:hypothetical protein